MGLILGLLALAPLLGLVPLHWFWTTGSRRGLTKMPWLSFPASFFWAWFSAYLCSAHPDRGWLSYALMALGTAYCTSSVWLANDPECRVRRALFALAAFPTFYVFNVWLSPLVALVESSGQKKSAFSNACLGLAR